MKLLERELDAKVKALCDRFGWIRYHVVKPKYGPAGFPDLTLARGDHFAVIELKKDLGARGGMEDEHVGPSPAQKKWLDAAAIATHVDVALWRPVDLEAIEAFLADPDSVPTPGIWRA